MAQQKKFHIGKNGPAPCKAEKRACRYGGAGENHYDTMEDAAKAYQAQRESEGGGSDMMTKKPASSAAAPVGSELNPAKNRAVLPNGTGLVVYEDGTKEWYMNGLWHREDGPAIEYEDGAKSWYRNGALHREDGPAVEGASGSKAWYKNGALHREDGPAIEYRDGTKYWYKNGALHREDGPAVERENGYKEYWVHGERMTEAEFIEQSKRTANTTDPTITPDKFPVGSEQNPAKLVQQLPNGTGMVENKNGKSWYKNGVLHREDGPAVIDAQGGTMYYKNGELHREDGPAVDRKDYKSYYVNGQRHRTDGPAVEYSDGSTEYYVNGERHREDGPAVESGNGNYQEYWVNGQMHNDSGPALVDRDNDYYEIWDDGTLEETGTLSELHGRPYNAPRKNYPSDYTPSEPINVMEREEKESPNYVPQPPMTFTDPWENAPEEPAF